MESSQSGLHETASPAAGNAAGPDNAVLVCEDLVIGYHGRPLLPPFSLSIRRGRMVIVVGRNGAGKSTWLKTVLGLTAPVRGRVSLHAAPGARAPRVAYVPQQAALDDLLPVNARTVVGWGQLRGWSFLRPFATASERLARKRVLEQVGAAAVSAQPFRDLSGGQRQRVLFARLLLEDLDLALLDEPTASMDMAGERQAYQQMAGLARERNMAVVVVTHTITEAANYADDVLFVDRGHGRGHGRGRGNGAGPGDGDFDGAVEFGPPDRVFAHPLFKHHFGEVAEHGD